VGGGGVEAWCAEQGSCAKQAHVLRKQLGTKALRQSLPLVPSNPFWSRPCKRNTQCSSRPEVAVAQPAAAAGA
jgi:hypothetical protein